MRRDPVQGRCGRIELKPTANR